MHRWNRERFAQLPIACGLFSVAVACDPAPCPAGTLERNSECLRLEPPKDDTVTPGMDDVLMLDGGPRSGPEPLPPVIAAPAAGGGGVAAKIEACAVQAYRPA